MCCGTNAQCQSKMNTTQSSGPSSERSPASGGKTDESLRLPVRGSGRGLISSLPDVGPAWWDNESEGVYSDDPEDGYPYDE